MSIYYNDSVHILLSIFVSTFVLQQITKCSFYKGIRLNSLTSKQNGGWLCMVANIMVYNFKTITAIVLFIVLREIGQTWLAADISSVLVHTCWLDSFFFTFGRILDLDRCISTRIRQMHAGKMVKVGVILNVLYQSFEKSITFNFMIFHKSFFCFYFRWSIK